MSVFNIKPSPQAGSTRQFIIPPTILSDYANYLMTEVPNAVYDFELIHNWYDRNAVDYEPVMLRAEHFPINWKSKVGNSDLNYNFYTTHDITLLKGDYVIREDGTIHMLNWHIQDYINAQTTQAIQCNYMVEITRETHPEADSRGYRISGGGTETIVEQIPCVMEEYAGRPDFAVAQNTLGVVSDMLMTVSMQVNPQTLNVRVGDEFVYGIFTYRVVSVDQTQIMIDRKSGIVKLYAKRVAGENL